MKLQSLLLVLILPISNTLQPPYISHSFNFPHTPYHTALPHIHTPERCIEPYAIVPQGFQITRTFAPVRYQGYTAIGFSYSTILGGEYSATMFASQPDCSQILFMDDGRRPYLLVTYSVKPFISYSQACRNEVRSGNNEGGSTLRITGSYLKASSSNVLWTLCALRAVEKIHAQHAIQFRPSWVGNEDPHLKQYRQMVLKI